MFYIITTLTTKTSAAFARRVRLVAASRKTTVSSFVRKAIENELAERPVKTFGEKFGHLAGASKRFDPGASMKEGY